MDRTRGLVLPKSSDVYEKVLITFIFAAFLFLLLPSFSKAYTEGTWWQNETSHWQAGTNQSIEVGSRAGGHYIKLESILPKGDTMVDGRDNPDGNYGSDPEIGCTETDDAIYMKFNLTKLSSVNNPELYFYVFDYWWSDYRDTEVYNTTDSWDESTITANNQPGRDTQLGGSIDTLSNGWYAVNNSEFQTYIQKEASGDGIASIVMDTGQGASNHYGIEVYAKENANYKPHLSTSGGWWMSTAKDWGETVKFELLRTDSNVTGGSISVKVEVSDDNFGTVSGSTTKSLAGGLESFDVSSLPNARYVRVNASFSSTNSDKELTTLHKIELIVNASNVCTVNDVDIELRDPDGATTGWFGSTYSSSSGTCGVTPDVNETWENASGYSYCPQEGSYDGRTRAYTEEEEATNTFSWNTSDWSTGIYSVNYDNNQSWCGCGDQYAGNSYNWLAAAESTNNANYPRCCGDESGEVWENGGNGNQACTNGTTLNDGETSSGKRYLNNAGWLNWCKIPGVAGAGTPYSWVDEWYECDFITAGGTQYYCGAGGTDMEGEWRLLENSGCQLVERVAGIKGGRIIIR